MFAKLTLIVVLGSLLITIPSYAQVAMPVPPTAQQQLEKMQQDLDMIRKERELETARSELNNRRLNEILATLDRVKPASLQAPTEFRRDELRSPESAALAYEAVAELAPRIRESLSPHLSRYSGVIIHNESDFLYLARYRLFRSEARIALANYGLLVKSIDRIAQPNAIAEEPVRDQVKAMNLDPVTLGLSLPSIASSYASSVANLLSVFRTETSYSTSADLVDGNAIGTILANELIRTQRGLKVYFPGAFVPEYDLSREGNESFLVQLAQLSEIKVKIDGLSGQFSRAAEFVKLNSEIASATALMETVRRQTEPLLLLASGSANPLSTGDGGATGSPIRQFVRAEKLDRFLRGGDSSTSIGTGTSVGILKLRVLNSGGSRRETRNLFRGNKIAYSGMAIIEVLLFDADGTLRESQIFSHHTGFRNLGTPSK